MVSIVKLRCADERHWYSSTKRLKEILADPYTPESFVIYLDENGEKNFNLLTFLEGKDVLINDVTLKIPN